MVIEVFASKPSFEWFGHDGSALSSTPGTETSFVVSVIGPQGPKGDPGADLFTLQLSEAVGGHQAVTYDGKLVTTSTLPFYAGVTTHAGTVGSTVTVRRGGIIEDASFTFEPGKPVFAGDNGALTQSATPPMRLIGDALSTNKLALQAMEYIGV